MGINTIIMQPNLNELIPLCNWVTAHPRLSHIYYMAVMRPFGAKAAVRWFATERGKGIWPERYADVEKVLTALIQLKQKGAPIGNSIGQLNAFKAYFKNPDECIKHRGCTLEHHALNVNAHGDAYLCFFHDALGNIRTHTPQELWQSAHADTVRSHMRHCTRNCELLVNCYYEDETGR